MLLNKTTNNRNILTITFDNWVNDQAVIDYSENGAFAPGQTYVALSRCRSLAGVRLLAPLKIQDIKVSQEVISFMSDRFVPVLDYIKRRLS